MTSETQSSCIRVHCSPFIEIHRIDFQTQSLAVLLKTTKVEMCRFASDLSKSSRGPRASHRESVIGKYPSSQANARRYAVKPEQIPGAGEDAESGDAESIVRSYSWAFSGDSATRPEGLPSVANPFSVQRGRRPKFSRKSQILTPCRTFPVVMWLNRTREPQAGSPVSVASVQNIGGGD